MPGLGETYSLVTALIWACSVILFRVSGAHLSPFSLNFFKNGICTLLLFATLPFVGQRFLYPGPLSDYALILVSGVVGIGISDTLFFMSLNLLGASRLAIVDCTYSPLVILFSFLLLGERLSLVDGAGALLILSGVALMAMEPSRESRSRTELLKGMALGVGAMATVGLAIVVIKPVFPAYPVAWLTAVRMAGGFASLVALAAFRRQLKAQARVFVPKPFWKVVLPASVLGSYVAVLLWMAGFKHAQAGVAALLNQTSAIFIVVLAAVFLKEPLTPRKGLAALLAFAGTVIVAL